MITEQQAVHTLYTAAGNEPYKTTASWTRTREFTVDTVQRRPKTPFVLDERFAVPDSYTSTQ
jgi:hypothetical protein